MTKRLVIGLVGPMASGKGVVADYLKAQGFAFESLSDRIREDMKARNIPLTRENLQNYGNYLREAYGNAVLAQRTVDLLSDSGHNVCIDSIRNPGELLFLRESLGALIIGIDAPEDLRLVWYLERAKPGEKTLLPQKISTPQPSGIWVREKQSRDSRLVLALNCRILYSSIGVPRRSFTNKCRSCSAKLSLITPKNIKNPHSKVWIDN